MTKTVSQFLTEYKEEIAQTRKSDNQKILIYSIKRHSLFSQSNLVGGLSDRLKGIVTCLYLAAITNRRLVIEWDSPFDLTHNFMPSEYDWLFSNAQKFIRQAQSVLTIDMIDRSDLIDQLAPEQFETELFKGAPVVVLNINSMRTQFFIDFFQKKFDSKIGLNQLSTSALKFLFRFVEQSRFEDSRQAVAQLRNSSDMLIGVHLRTGAGNGWNDPDLDDWTNFPKVLEFSFEQAKAAGAKNPGFYFLSDSVEARKSVLEQSWPHTVHCDMFAPTHMDRSQDVDRDGNDLTYHEFQMLSSADRIISGKGGFAALAAQMGGKPFIRYT